jgi:hypothetical protein
MRSKHKPEISFDLNINPKGLKELQEQLKEYEGNLRRLLIEEVKANEKSSKTTAHDAADAMSHAIRQMTLAGDASAAMMSNAISKVRVSAHDPKTGESMFAKVKRLMDKSKERSGMEPLKPGKLLMQDKDGGWKTIGEIDSEKWADDVAGQIQMHGTGQKEPDPTNWQQQYSQVQQAKWNVAVPPQHPLAQPVTGKHPDWIIMDDLDEKSKKTKYEMELTPPAPVPLEPTFLTTYGTLNLYNHSELIGNGFDINMSSERKYNEDRGDGGGFVRKHFGPKHEDEDEIRIEIVFQIHEQQFGLLTLQQENYIELSFFTEKEYVSCHVFYMPQDVYRIRPGYVRMKTVVSGDVKTIAL